MDKKPSNRAVGAAIGREPAQASYKEMLSREGLKNTKHRNSVLHIIEKSAQPVTAEQIYFALVNQAVSINLSSVYRVLNTLVEKHLIIKSSMAGENKAVFELNRFEHKHYVVCTQCKKVVAVPGCPLEDYEKMLADKIGFDVQGHQLELYGICRDCKK
ncbi:MAG: transcriptional repressor [Clostridiales bacterium]|nr:transcriptional repressor [Clostridiales bacterium]